MSDQVWSWFEYVSSVKFLVQEGTIAGLVSLAVFGPTPPAGLGAELVSSALASALEVNP